MQLQMPPLVIPGNKEVSLRAKHWRTRSTQAQFHVKLAANNSPAMKIGCAHTSQAVILLKEAYNRIRFTRNLAHFPALIETGIYDVNTRNAIGKFQNHFGLFVDGEAGKQTIVKMDELLLQIGD